MPNSATSSESGLSSKRSEASDVNPSQPLLRQVAETAAVAHVFGQLVGAFRPLATLPGLLKPRLVLAAGAAALLSSVFAPSAVAQSDDDEVVVRVGLHAAEKNLNPFIVPQALPITHDFTMLVYDTLFWSQSRLDPEPWLATGAEPSDDYRTWTVSLRDEVA